MPRRPGTDVYEITVRGAGPVASAFSRGARALQDEIIRELRTMKPQIDAMFDSWAPEDTGQTAAATSSVLSFRAAQPRLSVRRLPVVGHGGDPRDYFDVPRFGHQEQEILPRGRALKVHYAGHRNPHAFVFRAWVTGVGHPHPDQVRAAARGRVDMRAFRAAFKPRDWVAEAADDADRMVAQAARRLGRRIEARVIA